MLQEAYQTDGFADELFSPDGIPWPWAQRVFDRLREFSDDELALKQQAAERLLNDLGVTFLVYGQGADREKIMPFDLVPRLVRQSEWRRIEAGLKQRVKALNLFLSDIYGDQRILAEGVIPREVIESAAHYRPECRGLRPPGDVWCHIVGTDLIRGGDGTFLVLEDNLRCPSGVSYVIENRRVMKRTFPYLFAKLDVAPVDAYPSRLLDVLQQVAPPGVADPSLVLLSPGSFNSAYFEHTFLAGQMGIQIVEGQDLVVRDGFVFMRTTAGLRRVDVIYRRIDDDFLDPLAFRSDSMIGVPGIMDAYRRGRVTLVNAPGTGVADDKVVYRYVPDMIRFYLGEEPGIPSVPTYLCWVDEEREEVLDRIGELVVKSANESGGYGMLIGPASTEAERDEFRRSIRARPRQYIAQPVIPLSRSPVLTAQGLEGRHVDLRPFILTGKDTWVLPGGLTRVALRKGSLVVNSSQGGGGKDTWVVGAEAAGP